MTVHVYGICVCGQRTGLGVSPEVLWPGTSLQSLCCPLLPPHWLLKGFCLPLIIPENTGVCHCVQLFTWILVTQTISKHFIC